MRICSYIYMLDEPEKEKEEWDVPYQFTQHMQIRLKEEKEVKNK